MRSLVLAGVTLVFGTSAASAAITIDEARYEAGVLVVRGEVAPGAEIAVNDLYRKNADGNGDFIFRLKYKPVDCRVTLSVGSDTKTRGITNCDVPANRALDDRVPLGTTLSPGEKP